MGIASLWIAGIGLSIFQFFVLGSACLALAERYGLFPSLRHESRLLLPPAIGVCFSSLAVAFALLIGSHLDWPYLVGCLGLGLVLIVWASIFARTFFLKAIRAYLGRPLVTVLIVLGATIGTGAYLQFPGVSDSGQILWSQALMGGRTVDMSAMLGYSGMIAPVVRLFDALPIITSAAAYKPLLGILVCLAAYFAVASLELKNKVIVVLLFIAVMLLSTYGVLGIVTRGKDSIFGIAFLLCFLATLCRPTEEVRGLEIAIFFAAAATTGIVTVPYMLAGYALWLILNDNPGGALRTVGPMVILNALFLPLAIDGFLTNVGLLEVAAAYVLVGSAGLVAARLLRNARPLPFLSYWRPFLPPLLLLACVLLFPVQVPVIPWMNPDGTPQIEFRPPTDGETTFWGYMFEDPPQWFLIGAGLLCTLVIGFTRVGRQRAGVIAIASMPFFVLLLLLVRSHAGIPILSGFNVWDLVKDIPQWLAGPLFGLLLVVTLADLASSFPNRLLQRIVLATNVVLTIGIMANFSELPSLFRGTVTFTQTGGWQNRDLAVVGDVTWRNLRERSFLLDMTLPFAGGSFYTMQFYGAKPVRMDALSLEQVAGQDKVGIVVSLERLNEVLRWVRAKRASLTYQTELDEGAGAFVIVTMDGKDTVDLPASLNQAIFAEGAYGAEQSDSWGAFNWTRAQSKIFVPGTIPGNYCLIVKMFAVSGPDTGARLVSISGLGVSTTIDILASTPLKPASAALAVTVGPEGGMLELSANFPEIVFPNDNRPIAFGALLPLKLGDVKECGTASNAK